jgi:hypothetical protein
MAETAFGPASENGHGIAKCLTGIPGLDEITWGLILYSPRRFVDENERNRGNRR